MTIPQIIKEALKDGQFMFAGRIEEYVRTKDGAKFMTTGRRLREMREDNILEVKYEQVNGKGPKVALYRLNVNEVSEVKVIRIPGYIGKQLAISF